MCNPCVQSRSGKCRKYDLSEEASAALLSQSIQLKKKKNEVRDLHTDMMQAEVKQQVTLFLEEVQESLIRVADQHKLQYTGKPLHSSVVCTSYLLALHYPVRHIHIHS